MSMLKLLPQLTSYSNLLSLERVRALNVLNIVRFLHFSKWVDPFPSLSRDTCPVGFRVFRSLASGGTRTE